MSTVTAVRSILLISHPAGRKVRVRSLLLPVLLVVMAVWLSACGTGTSPNRDGTGAGTAADDTATLQVVTSYSILYDLVRNVGGDRVAVTSLVPPGQDPHTYEPVPADIRAVAQADAVFYNGLNLELWLERLIRNAGDTAKVVMAADGIEPRTLAGGDFTGKPDPHAWLDPNLVQRYVANIRDALIELDPAGQGVYVANAAAYSRQLSDLDDWIRDQVAALPLTNRQLLTTEGAFGYFAAAYDFEVVGFIFFLAPEGEPSAQYVATLVQEIRAQNVPALFVDTTLSTRLMDRLSSETGVPIGGALYVDSLGPPASGADTYLAMMRHNVTTLVTELGRDGR